MKQYLLVFSAILLLANICYGQDVTKTIPSQQCSYDYQSAPLLLKNGKVIVFYSSRVNQRNIYCNISTDSTMQSWGENKLLFGLDIVTGSNSKQIKALQLSNGRIVVVIHAYADNIGYARNIVYSAFSDNSGESWSPIQTVQSNSVTSISGLQETFDGNARLYFSYQNYLVYQDFINSSATWSSARVVNSKMILLNSQIIKKDANMFICGTKATDNYGLYVSQSNDDGKTWQTEQRVVRDSQIVMSNPAMYQLYMNKSNLMYIVYTNLNKCSVNGGISYSQNDLVMIKSSDKGKTWTVPQQITKYLGNDKYPNFLAVDSVNYLFFQSDRKTGYMKTWYGDVEKIKDTASEIYPSFLGVQFSSNEPNNSIYVYAKTQNMVKIKEAKLILTVNGTDKIFDMYDDGKHNDNLANDKNWGVCIGSFSPTEKIKAHLRYVDDNNNIFEYDAEVTIKNIPNDFRYLSAGSLHNWFSNYGSEIDEGLMLKQQYGMTWPAMYFNQHNQVSRGLWIGYNNGKPSVVHVGPRVTGENEFFPVKFKLYSKRKNPAVYVKSDQNVLPTVQDADEINPSLPFDQMIENIVNTRIGITLTRRIGQFSSTGHDNYIIHDYTLKNTGYTDATNKVQKTETLKNLYLFTMARISSNDQARYAIGNPTGWGMQTTLDAVGDGNADYPQTGVVIPKVRAQYAWHGKYPGFSAYDNVGGMMVDGNFSGGDKYDTTGRLGAPQFVSLLTMHASKRATDYYTDDICQPNTTVTIDSDNPLMSSNNVDNAEKCAQEYALMTRGHDVRHLNKIGEPTSYFNDAKPTKDPAAGTNGGYQMGNGYGPYTLEPGDSIRIVWAEVVDGLDRKTCIEVGKKYKSYGTAGMLTDAAVKEKNTSFFKGRDLLFRTMERAVANFKNNYADAQNSFVAPLANININNVAAGIKINWEYYNDSRPDSVIIYRTNDYYYNELEYKKIASIPSSSLNYVDTTAPCGRKLYYYVLAKHDNLTSLRVDGQSFLPIINNVVSIEGNLKALKYELSQNYPNPFNPSTIIKYSIMRSGNVKLSIYNILGQEVKQLVNNYVSAGNYEIKFDASDLPSGIYIYKLTSQEYTSSRKMLLVK